MPDRSPPDHRSFLRPFALTHGRTRSSERDWPLETLVQATQSARVSHAHLAPEHQLVMGCTPPARAIAELAVCMGVHVGVARVIINDMVAQRLVELAVPDHGDDGPDLPMLERLLDELKTI